MFCVYKRSRERGQSSHSGSRGGQGKRGPNQRVPNNPGQNRGKKKNRRGDGPRNINNQKPKGDYHSKDSRSNKDKFAVKPEPTSRYEQSGSLCI